MGTKHNFRAYRVPVKFQEIWLLSFVSLLASGALAAMLLAAFYWVLLGEPLLSRATHQPLIILSLAILLIGYPLNIYLFVWGVRGTSKFMAAYFQIALAISLVYLLVQWATGNTTPYVQASISVFGPRSGAAIGAIVLTMVACLIALMTAVLSRYITIILVRLTRYGTLYPPTLEIVRDYIHRLKSKQ